MGRHRRRLPATEETGKAIAWVNLGDPGHYKWSGEIDDGDGPGRRAPEKMVGAAGFEPATPTPPVLGSTFFSVLTPCATP